MDFGEVGVISLHTIPFILVDDIKTFNRLRNHDASLSQPLVNALPLPSVP